MPCPGMVCQMMSMYLASPICRIKDVRLGWAFPGRDLVLDLDLDDTLGHLWARKQSLFLTKEPCRRYDLQVKLA